MCQEVKFHNLKRPHYGESAFLYIFNNVLENLKKMDGIFFFSKEKQN